MRIYTRFQYRHHFEKKSYKHFDKTQTKFESQK